MCQEAPPLVDVIVWLFIDNLFILLCELEELFLIN